MKIIDINNKEITNPNLSLGYLKNDKIFKKHHEAIKPVKEQWHYETVAEYPNGGKDVKRVIDVVGVKAKDAWDEYEDVQRYIEYTKDELADINKGKSDELTINQRLDKLEKMVSKLSNYFDNHQISNENIE